MPISNRLATTFAATVFAATLAGTGLAAQGTRLAAGTSPVGTLRVDTISPSPTPVYAVNFTVVNSTTDTSGGGGGTGKATFSEFSVARQPDAASPLLFQAAATGQHIKDVQIDVLRTGSTAVDSSYILTDVLVSRFSTDALFEQISFTYGRIEVLSGTTRTCWDLVLIKSC